MHRQLHASHLRQIQPYNLWSSSSVSCIVSLSALSATATPFVILAFRDWWLVVQQIRGCFGKSLMCLAQVSSKKKWEVELIVLDFKVKVRINQRMTGGIHDPTIWICHRFHT
ncbi:uncharacterized protein LOC120072993 isoform X2 [Benincasa hispida]|uniref:uncharacterized protein LOC120072993 isoform X2 n=1 Tax=Benincasa hispida TaxID=102211 RepID=UPI001902A15D|nr:uncharacterized protein LOC120072993 isoform X2 [Benincasa hispida]